MSKKLKSVEQIVWILGGRVAAAEHFNLHPNAVDHWLNRKTIPCHLYPSFVTMLRRRGFEVGFELFRWDRAPTPKRSKRLQAA